MTRILAVLAVAVALAGCAATGDGNPGGRIKDGGLPVPVYRVTVDGRECLALKSKVEGYDTDSYVWSLTCNWNDR